MTMNKKIEKSDLRQEFRSLVEDINLAHACAKSYLVSLQNSSQHTPTP